MTTQPQTIGGAIARREQTPAHMIAAYRDDFATVLPAVIRPDTFVRLAQGVLRRDEQLMQAATESPASLMVALLDAARLGHEPGTADYYLTPRKTHGRWEVLGIEGYRGVVKRILNAASVLAVHVELVHDGDAFDWDPGTMRVPSHSVRSPGGWFGDRGDVVGAYAYADLAGGGTSQVVIIGAADIARAQQSSASHKSGKGPWFTDYPAMVRKTAAHRLEPWVPKSTTDQATQMGATAAVGQVHETRPELDPPADPDTGEVVDAELDEAPGWPEAAEIPGE